MVRDLLHDGRYYGQSHNLACRPILKRVAALKREQDHAAREIERLIGMAWRTGATWGDIGDALEISRQNAHWKYAAIVKAQVKD